MTGAEEWRRCKRFPSYAVSNMGRVRRLARADRPGIILRQNLSGKGGYPEVNLYERGKKASIDVHRLVAEAFCERPSEEHCQVDHLNMDHADCRAENLEWVTPEENIRRSVASGRHLKRLDAETVKRIKRDPRSYTKIHRATGAPMDSIREIKTGKTYKDI